MLTRLVLAVHTACLTLALAAGCASSPTHPQAAAVTNAETASAGPLEVPRRTLAPAPDYKLGAGDLVTVRVFELEKRGDATSLDLEVGTAGSIVMPHLGQVQAAGKTQSELRAAIESGLAGRVLVHPQVTVSIRAYRSKMVSVIGAVAKPGLYPLDRNQTTVLDALALAGGLAKEAGTRAVVIPGDGEGEAAGKPLDIDLAALIERPEDDSTPPITAGAVIKVPPADVFYVLGYVAHAGAFPYQRPTTVLGAVAAAGGLDERRASPSKVHLRRRGATDVIEVDLDEIAEGDAPDVPVYPGDLVQADRTFLRAAYVEFTDAIRGVFGIGFSAGAL